MEELLSLRDARTPVRLRFGRRSAERAVPHFFPQEVSSSLLKDGRTDCEVLVSRVPFAFGYGTPIKETVNKSKNNFVLDLHKEPLTPCIK